MDILSGSAWGRRLKGMPSPAPFDAIDRLVIHYTGIAEETSAPWEVADRIRSIQEYHLGKQSAGWVAIAYNFLIDKSGRVWEGRGAGMMNGANRPDNRTSYSVCLLNGVKDNQPTEEQVEAVRRLRTWLEKQLGRSLQVVGHRDVSSTACPGAAIYRAIEQGRFDAVSEPPPVEGMPIVGWPTVTHRQAVRWATEAGAHQRFSEEIIPALFAACDAMRVAHGAAPDPAIVIAQAAKETGWGRFSGVIGPERHNTAGIKTAEGGGNFDPDAHQTFSSWTEGARAHVNHLAAYTGLATVGQPHGRYYEVLRLTWAGSVQTVEQLGGRWAPAASYGHDIVAMVEELQQTRNLPAENKPGEAPEQQWHTVRQGDSWWRIAEEHLGSGHQWPKLSRLNGGAALHPGMRVRIR